MKKYFLLLTLLTSLFSANLLADDVVIAPYVDADDCGLPLCGYIPETYCVNPPLCCYLNFFGAPNWLAISGFDSHVSTKLGFMAGCGLGFQLGCYTPWLTYTRIEVEYSIRKNQLNHFDNNIVTQELYGSAATNAWMVDIYQDIPLCRWTIPYIGAGVGYSYRNRLKEVVVLSGIQDRCRGFAWQLIGGLSTPVNVATLLSVEYRYFNSPTNLHQQSIGLALRYLY